MSSIQTISSCNGGDQFQNQNTSLSPEAKPNANSYQKVRHNVEDID
jgi:hypothetical protein